MIEGKQSNLVPSRNNRSNVYEPRPQPRPQRQSYSNDASRSASRSKSPLTPSRPALEPHRPALEPYRPEASYRRSLEPMRPSQGLEPLRPSQGWNSDQLPRPRPPQQWQMPNNQRSPHHPSQFQRGGPQQPLRRPQQPVPAKRMTKANRALLQKQQQLLKAKQDAARKAFFAQKLPMVGDLWLHQLLINNKNRKKNFDRIQKGLGTYSNANLVDDGYDDGKPRIYRSLTDLNDPTLARDEDGVHLDKDRLNDVQMYGYEKYNRNKRRVFGADDDEIKENYTPPSIDPNTSFGHQHEYPYFRGKLTMVLWNKVVVIAA